MNFIQTFRWSGITSWFVVMKMETVYDSVRSFLRLFLSLLKNKQNIKHLNGEYVEPIQPGSVT
jgi:hypothetical protein